MACRPLGRPEFPKPALKIANRRLWDNDDLDAHDAAQRAALSKGVHGMKPDAGEISDPLAALVTTTAVDPGRQGHARRRDAPVVCPVCERRVPRRMRGQRYCSRRCRQRANYAEKVARGDFSTRTIARPTSPPKKERNFSPLQWAKTRSAARIIGPADVLAIEVLSGRTWQPAVSTDGVASEIASVRKRTLVSGPNSRAVRRGGGRNPTRR
jgi:hypothetical protein